MLKRLLRTPADATLQRRKQRADNVLRQADVQAERLISVLRMVIASALFLGVGGLLLSLDAAGLDVRHTELVNLLYGAGIYFLLGVANFYFSHPERFKFWQSWLFNTLEIAILGAQLFIDVRNPDTPSLVAFASPLLLVVTLVLAIQALRYRLELHVFTAFCLLIVCAAVAFYDPMVLEPWSDEVIEEMRVLYSPPPNVMRLIILTTLAGVVGAAVYRSRRLALRVAKEVEDAENLRRFLPDELRANLSDQALAELREPKTRRIVVVMIDLRGFTELTDQLDTGRIARLLSRFRSSVIDAVERRGGVVDKFIGDGAMMIFGLHGDIGAAVADGYAAIEEILASLQTMNESGSDEAPPLRIAVGLHAGPALVGAFGDDRRLEFTALGKTVNVASRLESLAKERDIDVVVSRAAWDLGGLQEHPFQDLGAVSVRGIADPVGVLGSGRRDR